MQKTVFGNVKCGLLGNTMIKKIKTYFAGTL